MRIKGPARINGSLEVPGDKSISHRVIMLASIASGKSRISGLASSADCQATLQCIRSLGVQAEYAGSELVIDGKGLFGYRAPAGCLDAVNSGSTIRMLTGLLAGQRFTTEIDGDASLRRRPMARIIEPLGLMGAQIDAKDQTFAPLTIHGQKLSPIDYTSPVASAQVKTCVLFAGLLALGRTRFSEPALSRNHTELMLQEFGAHFEYDPSGGVLSVDGSHELNAVDYQVPGDVSSAAFFIAAATILPDSEALIPGVSLNPTRTAFIDVLNELGARIETRNVREQHFEAVGDLVVSDRRRIEGLRTMLSGGIIPNIIDEIPILAVVATQLNGRVEVRDARELRIKESDRIKTVVDGIRALGGEIEEFDDGFAVNGPQKLSGGCVESAGDHRIAMAFAIAGLAASGTTEIRDADCASVSFPEFYETLTRVTAPGTVAQSSA